MLAFTLDGCQGVRTASGCDQECAPPGRRRAREGEGRPPCALRRTGTRMRGRSGLLCHPCWAYIDYSRAGWRVAAHRAVVGRARPEPEFAATHSAPQPFRSPSRSGVARQWRAHRRQPVLTAPSAGRGQAGSSAPTRAESKNGPSALDATAALCSQLKRPAARTTRAGAARPPRGQRDRRRQQAQARPRARARRRGRTPRATTSRPAPPGPTRATTRTGPRRARPTTRLGAAPAHPTAPGFNSHFPSATDNGSPTTTGTGRRTPAQNAAAACV